MKAHKGFPGFALIPVSSCWLCCMFIADQRRSSETALDSHNWLPQFRVSSRAVNTTYVNILTEDLCMLEVMEQWKMHGGFSDFPS